MPQNLAKSNHIYLIYVYKEDINNGWKAIEKQKILYNIYV